jgi:hypothetical protein
MNYLNHLFLVPRWFGWVAFDDVASSLACQGGPHNLSTPLLLCGKQVWRLRRRGRDRATCRRKEAGVACPCSWTLARAAERRVRKEAPPLPLSAQVGSPHARAGTLLLPLGRALEVAVGEAPLVVQRNRCPDWPPRGEREREGSWGGVAATAPASGCASATRGRSSSRGREIGEGGRWTEEPEAGDIF